MNTVKQFLHNNDTWQCPVNIKKIKLKVFGKLRNQISASHQSNFALLSSGMGVAWGANGNGKFGDNSITNTSSPTTMAGGAKFSAIAAKYNSSCGITFDGVAYCWGANANGQLGDNSVTMKSTPTLVVGNLRFRSIGAVGTATFIGLTNNGEIYSWGINGSGQLGDNSVTPRSSPVLVAGGINDWVYVGSTGGVGVTSYAIRASGAGFSWGQGADGQLGDGTIVPKSTPVAIVGGISFAQIAGGYRHAIGLDTDGNAWAWGRNASGELGDGTVASKSSPVAVLGGLKFKKVAAATGAIGANVGFSIGLTTDGKIYAWGNNEYGNLGDGTVTPRSSPVLVLGGKTNWVDIDTSSQHCMALDSSGNCYCWGRGTNGQLGNSTTTDVSSPVIVSSSQGFKVIDEIFLTEKTLDVIPNETYTVSLLNKTIFFGEYLVYDNNFTPIYLEISYGS